MISLNHFMYLNFITSMLDIITSPKALKLRVSAKKYLSVPQDGKLVVHLGVAGSIGRIL